MASGFSTSSQWSRKDLSNFPYPQAKPAQVLCSVRACVCNRAVACRDVVRLAYRVPCGGLLPIVQRCIPPRVCRDRRMVGAPAPTPNPRTVIVLCVALAALCRPGSGVVPQLLGRRLTEDNDTSLSYSASLSETVSVTTSATSTDSATLSGSGTSTPTPSETSSDTASESPTPTTSVSITGTITASSSLSGALPCGAVSVLVRGLMAAGVVACVHQARHQLRRPAV